MTRSSSNPPLQVGNGFHPHDVIRKLVQSSVISFANGFESRHVGEVENPEGAINMKIHNVFISVLGEEIQYYTALVRSFDSSLGNMLEDLAINIASLFYKVERYVEGGLEESQTHNIATILEKYKRHEMIPKITDYQCLRNHSPILVSETKRHESDYYLIDTEENKHYLIELKIGGDLDNKKARSEKEALLEQYSILSNSLPRNTDIRLFFATAYNRFGEGKEWKQGRVRQFFAEDELLIGKDFWNFITKDPDGYEIIIEAYTESAHFVRESLSKIKQTYLS